MEKIILLTSTEYKDLQSYCKLNNFNENDVIKRSYQQGYIIEKYGLLSEGGKVIEKEVIEEVEKFIEIPVEVIKEVVRIEYIEVEKPVEKIVEKEVIKEIIKTVEVPVEKVVYVTDQQEMNEKIFQKDQEIEEQRQLFSTKLQEKENLFQNEKKELSLKIQQLEEKPPKTIEVIKEVPVEKIVIEEKVVEVIKEVVVEKPVGGDLQPKLEAIQNTLQKIRQENIEKDKKIKEYEKTIEELQRHQEKRAAYLRGSNLDDTLYK